MWNLMGLSYLSLFVFEFEFVLGLISLLGLLLLLMMGLTGLRIGGVLEMKLNFLPFLFRDSVNGFLSFWIFSVCFLPNSSSWV